MNKPLKIRGVYIDKGKMEIRLKYLAQAPQLNILHVR
jgi:hypothetical protein